MFEIDDVKIGRAKVVSITEARQAMATIMTDREFSYIITKNNEPVRVVVNYETLKKFQLSEDSPPVKQSLSHDPTALLGTPLVKPAKQGRTLRGLLKEREEDLKLQEEIKPSQVEEKRRAVNDYSMTLKTIPFKPLQPPAEIESLKYKEPFIEQKNEEEISQPQIEMRSLPEVDKEEVMTTSDNQDYENNEFEGEFFGMEEPAIPEEEETVEEENTENKNVYQDLSVRGDEQPVAHVSPEQAVAEDPQANLTPEEKNYFRKFQKLYEPQETTNNVSSADENIQKEKDEDNITSDIIKRRGLSDFPSIDDLLKELEHTKLTGDE